MQLSILPVSVHKYYTAVKSGKHKQISPRHFELPKDTVSFTSKYLPACSTEELTHIVAAAVDKANRIGRGREGVVYRIPLTDYCVKIPHDTSNSCFGEWTAKVFEEEQKNHIVAKADSGAVVMKYIEGEVIPVAEKNYELHSLPLQTYKDLLAQLTEATEYGLRFDSSPYNIIFNSASKKFTAIDFYMPDNEAEVVSSPLLHVYTCLKSSMDSSINKKLAANLFNIILEELPKKNPEVVIDYADYSRFLRVFETGQEKMKPLFPQFKFLKETMLEIFWLKTLQRRGEDVTDKMTAKVKYAKCIVNMMANQA